MTAAHVTAELAVAATTPIKQALVASAVQAHASAVSAAKAAYNGTAAQYPTFVAAVIAATATRDAALQSAEMMRQAQVSTAKDILAGSERSIL